MAAGAALSFASVICLTYFAQATIMETKRRYGGMSLSLYVNDIETDLGTLRFRDPDSGPFIIQCNASDVFTDVTVRPDYNGEAAEFSPFLSLKDGSLMIGDRGLDLTEPGLTGADTDPYVGEYLDGGTATATFTDSTWGYLPNGTSLQYTRSSDIPNP